MTLGPMWQRYAPMIGRTLGSTPAHPERGERVILRRGGSSLEDTKESKPPSVMRLAAEALAGATSLSLELPSQELLAGSLIAGARLTIGAAEYTLAATAPATGATLSVVLTTGLSAPAGDEAPVTVHPEAVFTFEDCRVSRKLRRDLTRPLQADTTALIFAPFEGAPTTPTLNDMLELEDGAVGPVAHVISGGGAWRIQMGG